MTQIKFKKFLSAPKFWNRKKKILSSESEKLENSTKKSLNESDFLVK